MFGQHNRKPQSGVEMMLRSMGLGEAIDATKTLIESGAIKDFLEFVRDVKGLRRDIADMRREIGELKHGERSLEPGSGSRPIQSVTIYSRPTSGDETNIDGRDFASPRRAID